MIYSRTRLFPIEGLAYDRNRIPGMIVTGKGTLIAYNEARYGHSDWSLMSVFAVRSTDGGKTFGEPIYLAYGTEEHNVAGNPVMMEDSEGAIHFLYHEQYGICGGRILQRTSLDDGLTWSEPKDISYATLPDYRYVFAMGPGHGLRTPNGTLVVPVWFVPKYKIEPQQGENCEAHCPSVLSTLYSIDNGKTWRLGQIFEDEENAPSPNEAEFAVTSDGKIIVYSRVIYQNRAIAYSNTGYSGWSKLTARPDLPDSICFGSIISCFYNGKHALVTANCVNTSENKNAYAKRDDISVKVSFDDGKTWTEGKIINSDVPCERERGGYVELAYDEGRGVIYILHETDTGKTGYLITCDLEYILS